MRNRIIPLLLCAALLLALALPAFAEEAEIRTALPISSPEEFLTFAKNCRLDSYSQDLLVTLEADIDLSGTELESIPIFSGTFDGKGHSISGFSLAVDGSEQGLFRYLTETAIVQNLTLEGSIHPTGSRREIGGIAGNNLGQILNCSFRGSLSGGEHVGGIAGVNGVTGLIELCRVEGDIHGNHFVGGIVGSNEGVIRDCENQSFVNTTAQQNTLGLSDITLESLTGSESAGTVTDIGGIVGTSKGVIRGCQNLGDVGYQHMGYNIGGIAGTQSGYLVNCENRGSILGRKEVGGIAGQMEPVSLVAFTQDTLQILKGQLGTMAGLVNQASSNAQTNANQITGQITVLKDQARSARDAVDSLIPDLENPELPDLDAFLAAQNTLSSTIAEMPGTIKSITAATKTTAQSLTKDMQAISNQVEAMEATVNNAAETLGGSITDVSDQDTPEMLTGKIESCRNLGSILADLNAGGIVGAMAVENDLDILEDWQSSGDTSLNFEGEVRSVVLRCENRGTVTGKKQNVGGITGWQSLGLVKGCVNTGCLEAAAADYVGGISGFASGYIRESHVKCRLSGSRWVGGIAGSGTIVTDCLALTDISQGKEKLGAILGSAMESLVPEEDPISGNYYLPVSGDVGGIDGISYQGLAQGLDREAFLAQEALPELFRTVAVRFRFPDGSLEEYQVSLGDDFPHSRIPALPERKGYTASWQIPDTQALSGLLLDVTCEAVYTAQDATIRSEEAAETGLPLMLAQGSFREEASLSVTPAEFEIPLGEKEDLVQAWTFRLKDAGEVTAARLLIPRDADARKLKLILSSDAAAWQERSFTVDGSYLVFPLEEGDSHAALLETQTSNPLPLAAAGAGILAAALLLLVRKRKAKKAPVQEHQE